MSIMEKKSLSSPSRLGLDVAIEKLITTCYLYHHCHYQLKQPKIEVTSIAMEFERDEMKAGLVPLSVPKIYSHKIRV